MNHLPINDVINDIQNALNHHDELVLQAPPGAGKTTVVPLALLGQSWLKGKILVLEPRRMAARAAAERMASSLNEKTGERVGYRIRQETRVGPNTKIEVVTGGVLTRILQSDPSLDDYSLIIFDEFHERSLDSDLSLTLALHGRSIFRDQHHPLKLLVMSATLNGEGVSKLLNNAPIVNSLGRMFPVNTLYRGSSKLSNLVDCTYDTVLTALAAHEGSLLVFLPGQKEIMALHNRLKHQINQNIKIAPLYGGLSLPEQQKAIDPLDPKDSAYSRKIVLSTDIAETSLTINGITVVIDSGYRREPLFDPRTGLTRLQTVRISQASAVQRAGRAGRLSPGTCYRVWAQEECLAAFGKAEIEQADLSTLALQLLNFGVDLEADELRWITPPPQSPFNQALDILKGLNATEESPNLQLTKHGQHLADFPSHPRLAHMMILGAKRGLLFETTTLAAALSEPGKPDELGNDVEQWVHLIRSRKNSSNPWYKRVDKQSSRFRSSLQGVSTEHARPETPIGFLLALAYPDRIAKKREQSEATYHLSNGRSAKVHKNLRLAQSPWLCVAEIGGFANSKEDIIYSATAIDPSLFEGPLDSELAILDHSEWDEQQNRFIAEKRWCIGRIIWKRERNLTPSSEQRSKAISRLITLKGLSILSWDADTLQWCARVELLRQQESCNNPSLPQWPDVSENGLIKSLNIWLEPNLGKVTTLQNLKKLDLQALLCQLLPWPLPQRLNDWAPTHFKVPSGSSISIDYTQSPPVLAVKLQEMFGCEATPRIANRQVPLLIHLLSPARRPLQVTQDLAGFWRSSYQEVKKEMKGRYPKHPWPDNPLEALPTRFTKRRPKK